jgi:hypothetical protein
MDLHIDLHEQSEEFLHNHETDNSSLAAARVPRAPYHFVRGRLRCISKEVKNAPSKERSHASCNGNCVTDLRAFV